MTGHCTGDEAFAILHEVLGEKVRPMYAGFEFISEGLCDTYG